MARPAMSMADLLALPVSFDLETAGKAWGMGRTKSYELALKGEFPCEVKRLGNSYRVTKPDLFRALGLELLGLEGEMPAQQPVPGDAA